MLLASHASYPKPKYTPLWDADAGTEVQALAQKRCGWQT